MRDWIFVPAPLAAWLPCEPVTLDGFALPGTEQCFPLAVSRASAQITGGVSNHPMLARLFEALGGVPQHATDGIIVYVGQGDGNFEQDHWHVRWNDILPRAWAEVALSGWDARTLRLRLPMILARAAAQAAAETSKPSDVRSDTPHSAVTVQDEVTSHAGFFLTKTYQLNHPRFDGSQSPRLSREVFVATDAAIVLPYDPVRDRVLLVEQFRMGPFGRGDAKPWMLEPVAGHIDAGEAPQTTARRECEEEAGLTLKGLEHIASHYSSPGCSTEYFHCYLGLCDLPDIAQGHGGLATEQEDIRTHILPYDEAASLLTSGEADNGPLVLILIWLAANRSRLRASA